MRSISAKSKDLLLLFALYQGMSSLMPQSAPKLPGLQPLHASSGTQSSLSRTEPAPAPGHHRQDFVPKADL
jgi:hypothetical protein